MPDVPERSALLTIVTVRIVERGSSPRPQSATCLRQTAGALVRKDRPRSSGIRVAAAVIIIVLLVVVCVFAMIPVARIPFQQPLGSAAHVALPRPPSYRRPPRTMTSRKSWHSPGSYSQLEFNVTAVAQCDTNGYGPAYLLNGLSNTGYWYQVGINWDWPLQTGGYIPGFGFVSEALGAGRTIALAPFDPFLRHVNQVTRSIESVLQRRSGGSFSARSEYGGERINTYPANRATTFVGLRRNSPTQDSRSRPEATSRA